jgi:hypothetical protein
VCGIAGSWIRSGRAGLPIRSSPCSIRWVEGEALGHAGRSLKEDYDTVAVEASEGYRLWPSPPSRASAAGI